MAEPPSRYDHRRSPPPLLRRAETTFASEIEALVGEAGMRLRSNQYSPQSQTTEKKVENLIRVGIGISHTPFIFASGNGMNRVMMNPKL